MVESVEKFSNKLTEIHVNFADDLFVLQRITIRVFSPLPRHNFKPLILIKEHVSPPFSPLMNICLLDGLVLYVPYRNIRHSPGSIDTFKDFASCIPIRSASCRMCVVWFKTMLVSTLLDRYFLDSYELRPVPSSCFHFSTFSKKRSFSFWPKHATIISST